jgi:uncharacterized RDD family membrane protein YckC
MSHYGDPPPEDEPNAAQPPQPPGTHAGEPAPYNPYPTNWDAPQTGSQAFVAGDPYGQQPGSDPSAPPNPYGSPNPYGGAPGAQPGGNPYAGNPNPNKPTFGFGGYAGWLTRVGAYLIDNLLGAVAGLPAIVGYVLLLSNATTTTRSDGSQQVHLHQAGLSLSLIGLGFLTGLVFGIWNICIRQGKTGATIGKSVLAIRLVNSDMQPIGGGWCFLRQILHIVDSAPCYIGYLWPIWDSRKQTFADKILSTYVIQATAQEPRPY